MPRRAPLFFLQRICVCWCSKRVFHHFRDNGLMTRFVSWTLLFVCGIVLALAAEATADANVFVFVDRTSVAPTNTVKLCLRYEGVGTVPPPGLPALQGFECSYLGESKETSSFFGKEKLVHHTHIYGLKPEREGTLIIPGGIVKLNGNAVQTPPIEIHVSANPPEEDLTALYRLKLMAKQNQLVAGKPGRFELRLEAPATLEAATWSVDNWRIMREGFADVTFKRRGAYFEVIGGRLNRVDLFDGRCTPEREGAVRLGPAKADALILIKEVAATAYSPAQVRTNKFEIRSEALPVSAGPAK